jgi:hypothetical protein
MVESTCMIAGLPHGASAVVAFVQTCTCRVIQSHVCARALPEIYTITVNNTTCMNTSITK